MQKLVITIFLCTAVLMAKAQQTQNSQQSSGFQASPVTVLNYYDIENSKYFRVHIVEKGHTLYSIARAYKCALSDIIKTSPDNTVSIGEAVRIPMFSQKDLNSLVRYNVNDTLAKRQTLAKTADTTAERPQAIKAKPLTNQKSQQITTPTKDSSTQSTKYLPPQAKDIINISVMLPLYTSDVNFPKKQYYFLTMLEGMLVALAENDTLPEQQAGEQQSHPKINLNVFDLTENETSWDSVKNDKRFLSSDIILCAAYKNIFPRLDSFSKTKHIPLVHLHSERDSMSSRNPYFMQLLPSLPTQIEILADTFIANYNNSNFLIFLEDTNTAGRFQPAQYLYRLLEKAKNEGTFTPKNLHLYNAVESDGYEKVVSLIESQNHNVICGFMQQEISLAKMFVPLLKNNPGKESGMLINNYEISLFGPATWAYFTKIDPELFSRTFFTYFNTFTTQTDPVTSKIFEKKFYNQYGTLPDGMAYKGYMFAKWLFEAVQLYNTDFMSHLNDQNNYSVLGVKFNFQKSGSTSGYENRSIELVRFFE